MKAIKGNIAAIPISTGERIFFDIQRYRPRRYAKSSINERIIYPSRVDPFTQRLLPPIVGRRKIPCNLKDMELSHGTSDWCARPRFRSPDHRRQNKIPRLDW